MVEFSADRAFVPVKLLSMEAAKRLRIIVPAYVMMRMMDRKEIERVLSSDDVNIDVKLNWQMSTLKNRGKLLIEILDAKSCRSDSPVHDGNEANHREEEEDICVNFSMKLVMAL